MTDNMKNPKELARYMNRQEEAEFVRKAHAARAEGAKYAAAQAKKLKLGHAIIGEKGSREVKSEAEDERMERLGGLNIIGAEDHDDQCVRKMPGELPTKSKHIVAINEEEEEVIIALPMEKKTKRKYDDSF